MATGVSYTQWEAWLALYHGRTAVHRGSGRERRTRAKIHADGSVTRRAGHAFCTTQSNGATIRVALSQARTISPKHILSSVILIYWSRTSSSKGAAAARTRTLSSPSRPYLRLTQYVRRTKLAVRDSSETALLSAYRADVVPLVGRDAEMASLRQWLAGQEQVSIRVMVGAGGRGKTRLALEFAREIAKDGWLAGFVGLHTSSTDFAARAPSSDGAGTSRRLRSSIMRRAAPSKCAREGLAGAREGDLGALIEIADGLPNSTLSTTCIGGRAYRPNCSAVGESPARPEPGSLPWSFGPCTQASLNSLGNRLSGLGRREDALAAAQAATDLYRRLAAERPDAFRPDLAMSLNSLGARLSDLGRREDALAAAAGGDRHSAAASPPNGPPPSAPISPCPSTVSARG